MIHHKKLFCKVMKLVKSILIFNESQDSVKNAIAVGISCSWNHVLSQFILMNNISDDVLGVF